jgi:hypothetical protein
VKILFLIRSLNYGGAERQLVVLVKGLRERGHDVVVCIFYSGGPLVAEFQKTGVRLVSLNKKGRWNLLSFFARLVNVIRKERPDILHGYMDEPNNIIVLVKPFFLKIKIVWGIRSSAWETV